MNICLRTIGLLILVLLIPASGAFAQEALTGANSLENGLKAEKGPFEGISEISRFKKGSFFAGGNISFGEYEGENDFVVANIDIIEVDKRGINVSFVGGYFLNPLTSVGLRGKYKYMRNEQIMEADFLNLAFNANQYKTQSLITGFEVHTFMRNYVPIGSSGRFYTFSETSLYFIRGNSYQRATSNPGQADESISTILAKTNGIGAGISLGITYFSSKKFAFELQLGTTGLEVLWKDIEKDLFDQGSSRKVNFRDGISILKMQMGFTYYINLKK